VIKKVYPYQLTFKYPFKIAHGARTGTDVVYIEISEAGFTGYGEASLPPYLLETSDTVIQWLNSVELDFNIADYSAEIYYRIRHQYPGNMPALAALDMALWDLKGKTEGKSFRDYFNIPDANTPCTYTLGISNKAEMEQKIHEAVNYGFKLFKIKLNGTDDVQMLADYQALTHLPFMVDYNQALDDVSVAADKLSWLKQLGCILVEQPFKKEMFMDSAIITSSKTIPVYADESFQTLTDLPNIPGAFNGINIKLMKCGGLTEAINIITEARKLNLSLLIGCMSESSVGCTAAAQLAPLCDYADLDGPYLISNDPFTGMKVADGFITIGDIKGIGTKPTPLY
jgi:L-alanine-DL-glutamate epimerase-like enolase superfamily enzyme